MDTIEVQRLANKSNMPVIKLPYRNFPGVLVQGDTLASLFSLADQLHQLHQSQHTEHPDPDNDDGFYDSELLVEILGAMVREYESALKEHDIDLPYGETMTKSAWQD